MRGGLFGGPEEVTTQLDLGGPHSLGDRRPQWFALCVLVTWAVYFRSRVGARPGSDHEYGLLGAEALLSLDSVVAEHLAGTPGTDLGPDDMFAVFTSVAAVGMRSKADENSSTFAHRRGAQYLRLASSPSLS
ncbi:hypothetical protein [Micromonospora sp. IBSANI012]|uniref:hypothetical protein n=1 Tax=Micromonospora sp. IBSANI012 TaxID=3457761 RepID=UPI00405830D1